MTIVQAVRMNASGEDRAGWPTLNGLSDGGNIWFYRELRRQREARDLSQTALATRADMNHSTISRYEDGSRFPSRSAVDRISDALGGHGNARRTLYISAGFWPWAEVPSSTMLDLIETILYSGLPDHKVQLLRRTIAGLLDAEG